MEAANSHVIPIRRAIRRAGWIGDEFYPYSLKDGITAQSDGNETERILIRIAEKRLRGGLAGYSGKGVHDALCKDDAGCKLRVCAT